MNEGGMNKYGPEFNPERIGFVEVEIKTAEEAIALIKEFWKEMNMDAPWLRDKDYLLEEITSGDRTYAKEKNGMWVVYFTGNWNPLSNKAYKWLKAKDLLKNSRKI